MPERELLPVWLDYQRATLEMKCDGVPATRLRDRGVPPSSISLLGLVRHMADVERSWFRRTLDGEDAPRLYRLEHDRDNDFNGVDDADIDADFMAWRSECARAREVIASFESFDDVGRGNAEYSVRWVLIHMIEEYARHNGHADFLRERIDGAVGE
jgi:uncharacterized damage-inducible protein DinB